MEFKAPSFIKTIDHNLLVNHPLLWILKVHYFFLCGLGFLVLVSLAAIVYPVQTDHVPSIEIFFGIFNLLILVTLLMPWLNYQEALNIEACYICRKKYQEYIHLLFLFLSILLALNITYIPTKIISAKLSGVVEENELINDINRFNIGQYYLVFFASNDLVNLDGDVIVPAVSPNPDVNIFADDVLLGSEIRHDNLYDFESIREIVYPKFKDLRRKDIERDLRIFVAVISKYGGDDNRVYSELRKVKIQKLLATEIIAKHGKLDELVSKINLDSMVAKNKSVIEKINKEVTKGKMDRMKWGHAVSKYLAGRLDSRIETLLKAKEIGQEKFLFNRRHVIISVVLIVVYISIILTVQREILGHLIGGFFVGAGVLTTVFFLLAWIGFNDIVGFSVRVMPFLILTAAIISLFQLRLFRKSIRFTHAKLFTIVFIFSIPLVTVLMWWVYRGPLGSTLKISATDVYCLLAIQLAIYVLFLPCLKRASVQLWALPDID